MQNDNGFALARHCLFTVRLASYELRNARTIPLLKWAVPMREARLAQAWQEFQIARAEAKRG